MVEFILIALILGTIFAAPVHPVLSAFLAVLLGIFIVGGMLMEAITRKVKSWHRKSASRAHHQNW